MPVCPARNSSNDSSEKVLNVVKPPQKPVTSNSANCGFGCFAIQAANKPIAIQPSRLAANVCTGSPPRLTAYRFSPRDSPHRHKLPHPPPKKTRNMFSIKSMD